MNREIKNIVDSFKPVDLEDIEKARMMDRIDTKFLLAANRIPDLLNLMNGNYQVLEINNIRIPEYHTVYLDTPDYQFFNQHVTGRSGRIKIRFRKYESNEKTFLEIKKKTNKDRTIKWRIESNFIFNRLSISDAEFITEHIPFHPENLKPVLCSNFRRITFADFNSRERITIDFGLSYTRPEGKSAGLPLIAIVELKSGEIPARLPFLDVMKQLSVNPTGFSKYCSGLALLYDLPKINALKPKILLLNRIKNEYNGVVSA